MHLSLSQGTGKTMAIRCFSMVAEKLLSVHLMGHPNKPRVLLSAFTGKAASLIGILLYIFSINATLTYFLFRWYDTSFFIPFNV